MPLADPNISPDRVFDESPNTVPPAEALTLEFLRRIVHPARWSRDPQQPALAPQREPWAHQQMVDVPHRDSIPD